MNLFTSLSPIRRKTPNNNRFNISLFKEIIFEDEKIDYSKILLNSSENKEEKFIDEENRSFDMICNEEKCEKNSGFLKNEKKGFSGQIGFEESFLSLKNKNSEKSCNFSREKKIKKKKKNNFSPCSENCGNLTERFSENNEKIGSGNKIKLSQKRNFVLKNLKTSNDEAFLNNLDFIGTNQIFKENKKICEKKNFICSVKKMDVSILENLDEKLFFENQIFNGFLKNKKLKKSISVNLDNSQENVLSLSLNKE